MLQIFLRLQIALSVQDSRFWHFRCYAGHPVNKAVLHTTPEYPGMYTNPHTVRGTRYRYA